MLKAEQTHEVADLKEMCIDSAESYSKSSRDRNGYKVREMRSSIHSYMLVALNRFIDQGHMWILQNFIFEFKQALYRTLDQEYAPNSGTSAADEVKRRMEERPSDIKKRNDTKVAIEKLKNSLTEIETVNRT